MNYYFTIAGLNVALELPMPIKVTEESQPFLTAKPGSIDASVRFVSEAFCRPLNTGHWSGQSQFIGNCVYRYLDCDEPPFAVMDWNENVCRFDPERPETLWSSQSVWNAIGLEYLLMLHGCLLLHCALIRFNGRAILFSAPSGTGKSTQAQLWKQFAGAEILNGDRAALRCKEGVWYAWGLPYAGTSGIYRNEAAPVDAIVILRQAKENRVQRISPVQALTALMAEFHLYRWDSEYMERSVDRILSLIGNTGIFMLECRPDEGAVRVLQQALSTMR